MLLGLDFDNTLIRYDGVFHRMAKERGLVPEDLPAEKNAVRDYLRQQNREDEWTRMQGEAYGPRIREATAFTGMLTALKLLCQKKVPMCLVSHKTRTPYLGPQYDLHQTALDWLVQQGFFDPNCLGWSEDQVYFELTKTDKVRRIKELGCTHYVDDLPDILDMLPDQMTRIFFTPQTSRDQDEVQENWLVLRSWVDLPGMIL